MHLSSLSYQMPNAIYFQNGSLQTTTGYLYKLNIHMFLEKKPCNNMKPFKNKQKPKPPNQRRIQNHNC